MKIIICYNNPNRELGYLNELKSLLLNNKDVDNVILVNGGDTKKVISSVFKLKPKIILTYPLTGKSLPYKFYILKLIFKFKLICLRTEGAIEKENRNNVLAHVGIANYPKNLVDLELFWGQIQREILGQELVAQKKISSIDRCLVVGYPRINLYTGKKKNKIGIFTSFQQADYTRSIFLDAKDMDEKYIEGFLKQSKNFYDFREKFINELDNFLIKNKNIDFVIKPHPAEDDKKFKKLLHNKNIKILPKKIEPGLVFKNLKAFIHFGSTTLLDSFIYQIPSLLVSEKSLGIGHSYGWQSTLETSLSNFSTSVKRLNKTKFTKTSKIRKILFEEINFQYEKPYEPIRKIYELILHDKNSIQSIPVFNKFTVFSILEMIRLLIDKFILKEFSFLKK